MRLFRLLTPLLALALPLAACSTTDSTSPTATFSDTGVPETTTFASTFGINLKDTAWTRTTTGIYYRQLLAPPASAATVANGQSVTVNYAGYLVNGAQFDAGNFTFTLGGGRVIPGFDQGVVGMRVGERRLLLIPASLGYGASGSGPIPPNATLVFVVEVVTAQ